MRRSLPLGGNSLGLPFADEPVAVDHCNPASKPLLPNLLLFPSFLFTFHLPSPLPSLPIRPGDLSLSSNGVFGSGWGGIPQRSQRAQRCIGRGEKGPASEPFSTTALVN
jgi:hypothetical protein